MSGIVTELNSRKKPCNDEFSIVEFLMKNKGLSKGNYVESFLNVPAHKEMIPTLRIVSKNSLNDILNIQVCYVCRIAIENLVQSNKLVKIVTKKHALDTNCSSYILSEFGRAEFFRMKYENDQI